MIRNLTPHDVVIMTCDGDLVATIRPDGAPASRLKLSTESAGDIDGIPTVITRPIRLMGLPDPEPGVWLLVGSVVAAAARDSGRTTEDLLIPHGQVRNGQGQPVGCTALARVGG